MIGPEIELVPKRAFFAGREANIPVARRTVGVRIGLSVGPWQDVARAVATKSGEPFGEGSWGELLNTVQVLLGSNNSVEIQIADQPSGEHRVTAVTADGREVTGEFDDRNLAYLPGILYGDIEELRFQRRSYAWVEFRDVPIGWSQSPVNSGISRPTPATSRPSAAVRGSLICRGWTVELVGVGKESGWWRPDGSPLPVPPCSFQGPAPPDDKRLKARMFFLRLAGLPTDPSPGMTPDMSAGTVMTIPQELLVGEKRMRDVSIEDKTAKLTAKKLVLFGDRHVPNRVGVFAWRPSCRPTIRP